MFQKSKKVGQKALKALADWNWDITINIDLYSLTNRIIYTGNSCIAILMKKCQ